MLHLLGDKSKSSSPIRPRYLATEQGVGYRLKTM
jgi:hypothetical protein